METISLIFTLSTDNKTRVINGVASQNNYQETVLDENNVEIPNPETKPQFVKRMVKEYLKKNVKSFEANQAIKAARDAAIETFDNEVDIT